MGRVDWRKKKRGDHGSRREEKAITMEGNNGRNSLCLFHVTGKDPAFLVTGTLSVTAIVVDQHELGGATDILFCILSLHLSSYKFGVFREYMHGRACVALKEGRQRAMHLRDSIFECCVHSE